MRKSIILFSSAITLLACEEAGVNGVASKYPGDVGIGKHPAVLLAEDFEDEGLAERGWYDLHSWGTELKITDKEAATGKKSIELVSEKGGTGPWFRAPHFKHGIETMYVRYYRKWEKDWDWGGPHPRNGHETRLVANGPELPEEAYKGHDDVVLMLESANRHGPKQRGLFGLMFFIKRGDSITDAVKANRETLKAKDHRLFGNEHWFPTITGERPPATTGKWLCIEYMSKLNTPGKADGEVRCWIDGKLQWDVSGLIMRDGSVSNATWRRWWCGPYFHGGTTKEQSCYLDSLVIATEYIGPKAPAR